MHSRRSPSGVTSPRARFDGLQDDGDAEVPDDDPPPVAGPVTASYRDATSRPEPDAGGLPLASPPCVIAARRELAAAMEALPGAGEGIQRGRRQRFRVPRPLLRGRHPLVTAVRRHHGPGGSGSRVLAVTIRPGSAGDPARSSAPSRRPRPAATSCSGASATACPAATGTARSRRRNRRPSHEPDSAA